MNELKNVLRKEYELPKECTENGWQYHHLGIPVKEQMVGERFIPHLKMYVKGFETSPVGIEYMRFEPDSPVKQIIREIPHLAFIVKNIEHEMKKYELLDNISSPMKGLKVAMIMIDGLPVELMEFYEM